LGIVTIRSAAATSFGHDPSMHAEFPGLRAVAIYARLAPSPDTAAVSARAAEHLRHAAELITDGLESMQPSIQAWRTTFAALGIKPTQYRCAAESLLRRLRMQGDLQPVNPLVDLANAVSARTAIPVAVFDLDRVAGDLTVRHATGGESYTGFDGTVEAPQPGEVVFADDAAVAHSRRWCHRQSAHSAVTAATSRVLIVAEAMHERAAEDLDVLAAYLRSDLAELYGATPSVRRLYGDDGRAVLPPAAEA
jgi:DNA/RNA-binding domain of Phe-tRNA-synthetase-like protein